jgi:hypothetical protein
MMKSKFTFIVITISLLFFFKITGVCQNSVYSSDLVDKVGQGNINWSDGHVEAVGNGTLSDNLIKKINARPIALREAKSDALHNLLEIIKSVQVDSATAIKDFTVGSDFVDMQISGLVKGVEVVDYQYMPDGRAEVKLKMPLYGSLSQTIMPLVMKKPPAALPLIEAVLTPSVKAHQSPYFPVVYTGMVIDARGIQARPALLPRVFDENGKEVYGLSSVNIEYPIKEGMSGYSRDLTAGQSNQRVGANPITVKALRASGNGKSDIIISNADARKVRSATMSASFWKQCKVMIVLD